MENCIQESEKIHKNLRKSVKLFSYWARNIEIYIRNSQQLDKLNQELHVLQELIKERLLKPQTRESTREQTKLASAEELSEKVYKFNECKKQSLVIERFFKVWKEQNTLTYLCLDNFKDITEEAINGISEAIKTELVEAEQKTKTRKKTRRRSDNTVTSKTFAKNINWLTSRIKSYQDAIKNDDDIRGEIESKEKEIEEIISQLKQIEDFQFSIQFDNEDSTNFVAAEMGFCIEVQAEGDDDSHIDYYHYPVTFTNKNTFSIYNLQNEEFNYFSFKNRKLCHSNYIVDDVIIKHTIKSGRSQADPSNDYHSESVLFFLCQQRSFQEKMISKLIKDLQKNDLKLTKLETLILEIHSTNDICSQCFQKAKYLVNWKEENAKLIQEKQGKHFLEYFRQTFFTMLKKHEVLDQKPLLDISEVKILLSYGEAYDKASTESHPSIIRFKNNENDFLDSDKVLYKYSIITSGGVANIHNNYCYAYNKAVEPARKHAIKKITKVLKSWCEQKKTKIDAQVDFSFLIDKNPGVNNRLKSVVDPEKC